MRTAEDFKRAIGDAPVSFDCAVRRAVQGFSQKEKRKSRFVLVTALALALLLAMITAGFASVDRWDAWREFWNWEVRPEGKQTFNTDVEQYSVQTVHANFRVREAAYDGVNLYMAVEIVPRGQFMLIDNRDMGKMDTLADLADCYAMEEGTVAEYAQRMGKQVVGCAVSPHLPIENAFFASDAVYQADGSILVLYGYMDVPRESLDGLEITCQSLLYRDELKTDALARQRETSLNVLACHVSQTASAAVACNAEPVQILGFDLVVDDVRYVHSPLASYISFSVLAGESTDIERYGISQYSFPVRWTSCEYVPEGNRYQYWAVCEPQECIPEGVMVVIHDELDQRYQGMRTVPLLVVE